MAGAVGGGGEYSAGLPDEAIAKARGWKAQSGGLAQLARAPALQAGGHRFESDILHHRWPESR